MRFTEEFHSQHKDPSDSPSFFIQPVHTRKNGGNSKLIQNQRQMILKKTPKLSCCYRYIMGFKAFTHTFKIKSQQQSPPNLTNFPISSTIYIGRDKDRKLPTAQPYFSDSVPSFSIEKVLEVSSQMELPAGGAEPRGLWVERAAVGVWLGALASCWLGCSGVTPFPSLSRLLVSSWRYRKERRSLFLSGNLAVLSLGCCTTILVNRKKKLHGKKGNSNRAATFLSLLLLSTCLSPPYNYSFQLLNSMFSKVLFRVVISTLFFKGRRRNT